MALLAFDLFMKCRERIYEIRANEAKRRIFVLERMHGLEPSATACGPRSLPSRDHEEAG